jgi:hypothetical protein
MRLQPLVLGAVSRARRAHPVLTGFFVRGYGGSDLLYWAIWPEWLDPNPV